MPLTLALVDFLLSESATAALQALAGTDLDDPLRRITELRKTLSAEQAAALLEQAQLRQKAADKFANAQRMLFVDEALQQATTEAVADYHAGLFVQAGVRRVLDLGCGIGGDAIAMARAGLDVVAVELDPVRARLAQANLIANGLERQVEVRVGDWTTMALRADAAFADPARRVDATQGRKRVFHLDQMLPPITAIHQLRQHIPAMLVKVAPGLDHAEIPEGATVKFVAEGINLKECLLCFGAMAGNAASQAVVLPEMAHLDSDAPQCTRDAGAPGSWLYEPNPAVIRAGLVKHLAHQLNAHQLDETIAYLTGDTGLATPLARVWPVLRWGPFNLKHLNRWLREEGAGHIVVKKRGSPIEPDSFRKRLKLQKGGRPLTVFLTQCAGNPCMLLCGAELLAG